MLLFANIKITLHFVLLWKMNVSSLFDIWHITTAMLFDININIILIFHYLIWLGVSAYLSAQLKGFIEMKTESLEKTKLLNWKWQKRATSSEEQRIWRWQHTSLELRISTLSSPLGFCSHICIGFPFQTAMFAKYLLSTRVLNSYL